MKKKTLLIIVLATLHAFSFGQKYEYSENDLKFEIKQIVPIGEQLRINFLVTNTGIDKELTIIKSTIKLFDTQGNTYEAEGGFLGDGDRNSDANYMTKMLISGIPMRGQLIFKGATVSRNKISMIEVPYTFEKNSKIQLRDLPIPFLFQPSHIPLIKDIEENSTIEITSINYNINSIVINSIITNKDDDMLTTINFHKCRLIDSDGNEIECSDGKFGNNTAWESTQNLIKDIPIKASFIFQTPTKPTLISLFELTINKNIFTFKNLGIK